MHNSLRITIFGILWLIYMPASMAAGYEILGIETVFSNPLRISQPQPLAIVISSGRQRFSNLPQNTRNSLKQHFVYQTRVSVNGTLYYRLAVGNFKNLDDAKTTLAVLKPVFSKAWIYQRSSLERQKLREYLGRNEGSQNRVIETTRTEPDESLLAQARRAFLDENYARVITITNQIMSSKDLEQVRASLELAGTARERQGKYTQALNLYEILLETDPPADISARVMSRIEGIRTMGLAPKTRLQASNKNPDEANWHSRSLLHQYYRDDIIDRADVASEEVNRVLVSDVDLRIQRRTRNDSLSIEIDAGLVNDFIDDQNETRVSQASLSYARDEFRIIGGRQHRTVKGVYGRFDGFTYRDLSRSDYQISYFLGNLATSAYDNLNSDNPLLGANLDFNPYDWLEVNFYLITQEISGLTDRQALGGEFRLESNAGFIFGLIDYDVFYDDLNNIQIISTYRYDPQWSFNLSLGRVNSPPLSTQNALQGQTASSIEELNESFSADEIYRLAEDRTSNSETLYFGANYSFDSIRQLTLDLSIVNLDATVSSAGVDALPGSRDVVLSVDYSSKGFFSTNDYTSIGLRLSDLASSEIQSLRLRSRISGHGDMIYDPRVRIDFRKNSLTGIDQFILAPSIKLGYRASKRLHFETDLGIEYSDLDLPDSDRQIAYSLYLGYNYLF